MRWQRPKRASQRAAPPQARPVAARRFSAPERGGLLVLSALMLWGAWGAVEMTTADSRYWSFVVSCGAIGIVFAIAGVRGAISGVFGRSLADDAS